MPPTGSGSGFEEVKNIPNKVKIKHLCHFMVLVLAKAEERRHPGEYGFNRIK